MREYSIVLPTHDNDGLCLEAVHKSLKLELISLFSGYSATAQTGGWVNAEGELFEEPSIRYTVAAVSATMALTRISEAAAKTIIHLAIKYGIAAKQQAMYMVIDGTVEILTIGE